MSQGWQPGQPPQGYGPPQPPYPQPTQPPPKSNTGLIIGIVVGVLFVIGGAIGVFAYIAVSGVNRYKQSAKTAEAKNTITTIARQASRAYEEEQFADELLSDGAASTESHVLCKSARPVPASVPKGGKYQPRAEDYDSGSKREGWRCLKFVSLDPTFYQYEYRVGGDYKGPKRGGPDPGPDGFEVSAEGDLDGNGKTSLFTLTGKVDKVTRSVKLTTQVWSVDEVE